MTDDELAKFGEARERLHQQGVDSENQRVRITGTPKGRDKVGTYRGLAMDQHGILAIVHRDCDEDDVLQAVHYSRVRTLGLRALRRRS